MTGNPSAKNLGRAAPSRPSSVSGARPVPTEARDSWHDVDDLVEVERRPAPSNSSADGNQASPLELEQMQRELEQLRRESARRIRVAESERDAALAVIEELRGSLEPAVANLTPPAATQPPPLPASARGANPGSTRARTPSQAPESLDAPTPSRRRDPGSVPTLSEVLVAADLAGSEPRTREPDERRSEPRIFRQFEIEFNYETHFFAGLTLDISSGGLFIATYHLLPVGTPLSLSFQLPNGVRLSVQGEVRWVRCASEGHERPGMGVAFKELPANALAAIAEFCAERPPLYIDL